MTKDYILNTAARHALHIDYARELNEQQLAAVSNGDGPSLVIAGAGSGKTRTLTYRVAWLVEHGVPPERILLLTFTNKAAKEMLSRVQTLLSADPTFGGRILGGTFHSVGARVLRRHAKLLAYGSDFSILDREDSKDLIDHILKESRISTSKDRFPKSNVLLEIFSLSVNTERTIPRVIEEQYGYFGGLSQAIGRLHEVYQERKRKTNAMDFDDLLSLWLRLLRDHAEVREYYSRHFQHVLVDEYQDTNKIQADIVDLLASQHGQGCGLMAVGDDSQSIYSWRGANHQNIIGFPERYTGCRVFKIESNYRSTPQILNAANAVIRANPRQFPKQLHTTRPNGARPVLAMCMSGAEEAAFVVQHISELQAAGVSLNEMAVLYRAHFHSMDLQMTLTRAGTPFIINSGIRFFEQAHIKDVAAFLRLSANPSDELSFKRIAKMLPGVGNQTADKLWGRVAAQISRVQPPETADATEQAGNWLHCLSAKDVLTAVPVKSASQWKQLAHTFEQVLAQESVSQKIQIVLDAVYDSYLKSAFEDYSNRRDDLERLMDFAASFKSLQEFLEQMALLTNVDSEAGAAPGASSDSLWLSTVHQAKGLEWRVVFIVGLADEMFPSKRAMEVRNGEEEERRLFYVAITRAKDELYLSFPMSRGGRGQDFGIQRPSRFLKDIPEKLLEKWNVARNSLGPSRATPRMPRFWTEDDRFPDDD